jgi:hypothetical protein
MVEMTTNRKGAIAETAIAHHALRAGVDVYRPVAEGGRFDLVFAFPDGALARVQCKWAGREGDVVVVRPSSARRTREGIVNRPYTAEEIDAVAAYCADTDCCYYLPAAMVVGRRCVHLRLAPSRNNQAAGVHWAADHELGAIAQLGERLAGSQKVAGSSPASSTPARPS